MLRIIGDMTYYLYFYVKAVEESHKLHFNTPTFSDLNIWSKSHIGRFGQSMWEFPGICSRLSAIRCEGMLGICRSPRGLSPDGMRLDFSNMPGNLADCQHSSSPQQLILSQVQEVERHIYSITT